MLATTAGNNMIRMESSGQIHISLNVVTQEFQTSSFILLSATSLEPFNLKFIQRVVQKGLIDRPIGMFDLAFNRFARSQIFETLKADLVDGLDLILPAESNIK
ncbi:hypothetical protein NQ317_007152 [Molorchus minor]|uniref:Uncharacterized protein n=1 Tax=Molorchus minor TaxID=1323400 RepID=A0ABQ9J4X2_9CUCU|nr:hypothetical protein NQ317_007152 [Molorchus minor]